MNDFVPAIISISILAAAILFGVFLDTRRIRRYMANSQPIRIRIRENENREDAYGEPTN
jgi:hypothetical protein